MALDDRSVAEALAHSEVAPELKAIAGEMRAFRAKEVRRRRWARGTSWNGSRAAPRASLWSMIAAAVLAGWLGTVESSARGERCALGYFGEVLVEEHPRDELLARSDADLLVEALGVVLDCVR